MVRTRASGRLGWVSSRHDPRRRLLRLAGVVACESGGRKDERTQSESDGEDDGQDDSREKGEEQEGGEEECSGSLRPELLVLVALLVPYQQNCAGKSAANRHDGGVLLVAGGAFLLCNTIHTCVCGLCDHALRPVSGEMRLAGAPHRAAALRAAHHRAGA